MTQYLPSAFLERMKTYFPDTTEYQAFLDSYEKERSYGLRRNPLKYTKEAFEEQLPFQLKPVPWCEEGYFYDPNEKPGKSPYHENGSYYIQEPSAMIVAELLSPQPGDYVCDLCAAPGGKSSQIAGRLQGKGLLVSNEYVAGRAQILAQNMERMGVRNCVVFQEDTGKLRENFGSFFHKVVIDAPCSGEGMFRKEEVAVSEWSEENVKMCAKRQLEILENGADMLRPGGVLVYSTCTFSREENEQLIQTFLQKHPEFEPDTKIPTQLQKEAGIMPGEVPGTIRMWPHKLAGEGHFAARLVKRGDAVLLTPEQNKKNSKNRQTEQDLWYQQFSEMVLTKACREELQQLGNFVWRGDHLYLIPGDIPGANKGFAGMKVVRPGLLLGEAKKNRFEPSHTLAMCLKKEDVLSSQELTDAMPYLRGEVVSCKQQKGWTLVLYQGQPLGWGKASNGVLKNHYPKGIRKG